MTDTKKHLVHLETVGLIRLAKAYPELEFMFRHALVQEVAYNSLLFEDRKKLHRQIAEAMEEVYPDRLYEMAAELARHYIEAGEEEKAVVYLLRAGDQARGQYAHPEAIEFYQQALELLKEQDDYERAARTLMKLGLTYHNAFDFRQARQAYQEGFELWQKAAEVEPTAVPPAPHPLRLALPYDIPTLDPALARDTYSARIIDQLFTGLVSESADMGVVPDVALNWDVSEGGRKYTFHLRDDVRWSDNKTVTAQDFEYAWKRVLDPATGSSTADLLYDVKGARAYHQGQNTNSENIGVHAFDATTLVVELEKPTSYFLHLVAHTVAFAVPRHSVDKYGESWTAIEKIVTNGPFRLEFWKQSESLTLVHNPTYHSRFKGNVQQVELSIRQEETIGLEMYEAANLDVLDLSYLSPTEMDDALLRYPGEYISLSRSDTFHMGFDVSRPPFDDLRVRRAFIMAVDRERYINEVDKGFSSPATGGFVPPGMVGYSPDIGLPYNPDQARRLLAEAGYPNGRGFPNVQLLWSAVPHGVKLCEVLQAQWRENLGVKISWEALEWAVYLDRLSRELPSIFILGWTPDYPDPDSFMRGGVLTVSNWRNEAYDQLVEEARHVTDQKERMQLYQQADKILVEEAAITPLFYAGRHLLVKPWVKKYPISVTYQESWKDVIIEPH